MPDVHAYLSASGAHRWLHCPPSVKLEEQFPDKGSDYAAEGTLAHKLAELKLRKHYAAMKPAVYKKELKAISEDPLYSQEMNAYTDEYLDYIKDLTAAFEQKPYVAIEQRLDFSNVVPGGFGTGDCIIIGAGTLLVVDFKYGQGVPVAAENNPQMKLYAIGAINAFTMLYDIELIRTIIFQPRIKNTSCSEITPAELSGWSEEIRPIARLAIDGKGDYSAGDWCRFCRAKNLCRARSVFSQETYDGVHGMTPPLISAEEVGEILKRTDDIKKWISDLEEYALSECLAGNDIPGWKAVEGRSTRQFDDVDKAFETLHGAGYDDAVLYERKPLTLAALEKFLGKKNFEELLSERVIKPAGKPTLAAVTDKREAITNKTTAAEAFSAEGETT